MEFVKQKKQVPDNEDFNINNLPDDCLIEIFALLSFLDRVRIQRVCKRWHDVSRKSWHKHKTLCLDEYEWNDPKNPPLELSTLENVLKLCGPYVTRVDFGNEMGKDSYPFTVDKTFFSLINEQCPKITAIAVNSIAKNAKCFEHLAEIHTNLTELRMGMHCYERNLDQSLALLFKRNQKLRRLNLCIANNLNANYWLSLNPEAIKDIAINGNFEPTDALCRALKSFKNLQKFTFSDSMLTKLSRHVNKFLTAIEFHAGGLKHLEIHDCFDTVHFKNVSCFPNLQILVLRTITLNDKFFEAVSRNCVNLTYLYLDDIHKVTDVSMKSIAKLPKLQILRLSSLEKISGDIFNYSLFSLKELYCFACPRITTSAVCEFLRSSKSLEHLKILSCHKVCTNDLINVAKEVTETREHGPLLKLTIGMGWQTTVTRVSRYFELIK